MFASEMQLKMPHGVLPVMFSAHRMDLRDIQAMGPLKTDFTCAIMSVNFGLGMYDGDSTPTTPEELAFVVQNLWTTTNSSFLTLLIAVNTSKLSFYQYQVSL